MVTQGILDAVGNTPLLEMEGIFVKAEYLNPSGSVKDRIALYFVEQAEKRGLLKKGSTIVEASTGNTGTALSLVGAAKGYHVVVYMAKGLTKERYQMMKAFGAEVRFVPKSRMDLAVQKAAALGKKKGYFHTNQFANPWNAEEHEKFMGREIVQQLGRRRVDAVVAGIGTGGTIIGLTRAFRKVNPTVRAYGVEPAACALTYDHLHTIPGICRPHQIEGIADGFVPPLVHRNMHILTDIIKIPSTSAIRETKRIAKQYGCFVGVCSGANLLAAKMVKGRYGLKTVVTVFTDEGEKYLSEPWFTR